MGRPDPQAQRTADHWSAMAQDQVDNPAARAAVGWLDSPLIQHLCINPRVSGQATVNWLEWAVCNHVPMQARHACTLGCGAGGLERHARHLGLGAHFDALDISPGAVEVARAEAGRGGLTDLDYRCVDLEEYQLPAGRYDVVFAAMSLHHLHRLEEVLQRIHRGLVPGGLLVWNEFIGPRRFQWTDLQLALSNALLATLPEHLRQDLRHPGSLRAPFGRPTIAAMDAVDPSEAALSDQIVPLCDRLFEPVVRRDYGGTLLHLLLDSIIGNFRLDRPADLDHLRRVCDFEAACLAAWVLPSDFALGIYRRRG